LFGFDDSSFTLSQTSLEMLTLRIATFLFALSHLGCASAQAPPTPSDSPAASASQPTPRRSGASARCPDTTIRVLDTVYTELQVERAVRPLALASPVYPEHHLLSRASGEVRLRFVVNTEGCAEPGSLQVIAATDSSFARAARTAVRRSRYQPALFNGRAVRQQVEFPFTFIMD